MTYKVTVTHDDISKAVYRKLGADRWGDLMEEYYGAADKFAHIAFPSIIGVVVNPDPEYPDMYVGSYTFEFADEAEAVHFRMTA